jgi:zinc transporter, ZIP family
VSGTTAAFLGAIAGLTIFVGLPVARVRGLDARLQGFLNALATGILIFLLVDILSQANEPVRSALDKAHNGQLGSFLGLLVLYVAGLAAGLLGLTWFNRRFASKWLSRGQLRGPGAAVAASTSSAPSARGLALMIATGLGMHNFSEGLAIGQSAAAGALAFTGVLVIGFGLHNITEGLGVAAPLASREERPSWGFLGTAGLIGGGPTFVGTMLGYNFVSTYAFVLFLALAGGALIYVINEMFNVSRKLNTPTALAAGLLTGFLAGFGTDLLLNFVGG